MLRSCLKHKLGYNMPIQTIGLQVRPDSSARGSPVAGVAVQQLRRTADAGGQLTCRRGRTIAGAEKQRQ
jgi:hypothetical protein